MESTFLCTKFSPPAWGWSVSTPESEKRQNVLPTRVGMVRTENESRERKKRSPHPRGDGPAVVGDWNVIVTFSPPAWGWSGGQHDHQRRRRVLPTRVGMVRN